MPLDFYRDFSLSALPTFLRDTFLSTFFGFFLFVFSLHMPLLPSIYAEAQILPNYR